MSKIELVKASSLVEDFDLYPRAQVDSYHVSQMVEALESGGGLPPLVVERKTMRVVDGFHRLRAFRRVLGPDADIPVIRKTYPSEAAVFEEAMRLNSGHGRSLTPYDKVRSLAIGGRLGLTPQQIAGALRITVHKAEGLVQGRMSADGLALKRTMAHLAGEELTPLQRSYNKRAGGLDQIFYINQVALMLESDSVDWENARVREGVKRLAEALKAKMGATA